MYKLKKIILLTLIEIMVFLPTTDSLAKSVTDLKSQQKNIQTEIKDTTKKIEEMKDKKETIEDEIMALDKKATGVANELNQIEHGLLKIRKEIKETEDRLLEAEENIENKTEAFSKRLRQMYKNGNTGYLEVLFSASDIKDFLSRQNMIEAIAEQDKELIAYMKEQRESIESNKIKLEGQRASIETTKANIVKKKSELERVSREKENLIGRLVLDIVAYEKEYDKLNELAKGIEAQIIKLQSNSGVYAGGKMGWPVPGHTRISSPYGTRIHPIFKVKKLHTGIDIPAPMGSSIIASAGGSVVYSAPLGGYGNTVMIDHGGKILTLYAHNSVLIAKEGDTVNKGDVIAKAGSTGNSTGPHLHFEVRKNGVYVDPISWLQR